MGSNPIIGTLENAILLGKFVTLSNWAIANGHASKRTKRPSIGQLFVK
jgi:hypothetical protein